MLPYEQFVPHDLTIVEDEHVGNGMPAQQLLAGFRERLYPGSSSKVLVRRDVLPEWVETEITELWPT